MKKITEKAHLLPWIIVCAVVVIVVVMLLHFVPIAKKSRLISNDCFYNTSYSYRLIGGQYHKYQKGPVPNTTKRVDPHCKGTNMVTSRLYAL